MDRLLSEQELMSVCNNGCTTYDCKHSGCHARLTAAAQLAKADKEWVEWIEKLPYEQFDNEGFPTEIDSRASHRCYLIGPNTLQERKKEIGVQ